MAIEDEEFREEILESLRNIERLLEKLLGTVSVLPHNIAHKQGYQSYSESPSGTGYSVHKTTIESGD